MPPDVRAKVARAYHEAAKATDREYVYLRCPACQADTDRKRKLWVRRSDGVFACWRCGVRGRVPGVGSQELPEPDFAPPTTEPEAEPIGRTVPVWERSQALQAPQLALHRRGVPPQVWRDAGLLYALDGRHKGRVARLVDAASPTRGWVAWDWTGRRRPRYYTAKGTDRRRVFLGEDVLRKPGKYVVVVEGMFDMLRLWPHAVACLGKPTRDQIVRLAGLDRPVVVVLDGDAWQEGYAAAEQVRLLGGECWAVLLPSGEDPDSVGRRGVLEAVEYAVRERCDADMRHLHVGA